MKKNKVFLGGTCFGRDWRKELMPNIQVDHYNPLVEDWTEDDRAIEKDEQENKCNIHLYVITSPKSIFSIAEAVQSSHMSNKSTILHVVPSDFSKEELKHMNQICELVKRNGAVVYIDNDLLRTAKVINYSYKTSDFN